MSEIVFFATSAINTSTGIIPVEVRLQQTLDTARSIKAKIPHARIILLEGGYTPLNLVQRAILLSEYNDVIDYSYHPKILQIQSLCQEPGNLGNTLYLKGPCEAYMLWLAVNLLPKNDNYRYFKISGRYMLSENFNIENHLVHGKYVFKQKDPGVKYYGGPQDENGNDITNWHFTEYQYKTRLYSFCGSILEQVKNDYLEIFETIIQAYTTEGFIDLEHATYKTLNPALIHEIQPIGLMGIQAENGEFLSE